MLLTAFTLSSLLLSTPAYAQDEEETQLYMVDMRMEVELPEGWSVPRWSDWDLDAVDARQEVQVHIEYTPYQVEPSKDSAKVWTGMAANRLRDAGHKRVEMQRSEVVELNGAPIVDIEISYRYEGSSDAVYVQRSYNTDGRAIHLGASALKRNARKAEAALDTWQAALKPKSPAQDLSALSMEMETEAGFASLLPPGWRPPIDGERTWVREIAATAGQANPDKEKCWVGLHPYPDGQAALLLSCNYELYTGLVDEHSWDGWEAYMRDHFFKGVEVPKAERITASEDGRLGFLYTLPDVGDRAIRMAVVPYNRGHVLTYAIGRSGDTDTLNGAIRAVQVSTRFTDEDGAHPVGAYQYIDYYWNHRRSSPVVWGPAVLLLGLLGALVMKLRGGSKPKWDDDDV